MKNRILIAFVAVLSVCSCSSSSYDVEVIDSWKVWVAQKTTGIIYSYWKNNPIKKVDVKNMFPEPRNNQIGILRPEEREEFKQLLLLGGKIYVTCSLGKDKKGTMASTWTSLDLTRPWKSCKRNKFFGIVIGSVGGL